MLPIYTFMYAFAMFTSAFLLFLIQPMISKILLPYVGGSPALWNTSMMFFQALLLLGYVYAHISGKWLGAKRQIWLHFCILLIAVLWLPITIHTELNFVSAEYPILWVIVSLFLTIGVPFLALAASAPLLQFWLAHTRHHAAANPYFLYSASNVGSLLALLSYPFIVEPGFTLSEQAFAWSCLFILFILMMMACGLYLFRHYTLPLSLPETPQAMAKPVFSQRLYWLALSFVPSSLLLGLTTYITTDIAALPLFWVIPLALYLLTFILAFAKTPKIASQIMDTQRIWVPLTLLALISKVVIIGPILLLHLVTFFVVVMNCHYVLAQRRPHARYLTEYYVWIALGGLLGGIFNTLIAPSIFTEPLEYPLMLLLSLLLHPATGIYRGNSYLMGWQRFIPDSFMVFLCLSLWGLYCLYTAYSHTLGPSSTLMGFFAASRVYNVTGILWALIFAYMIAMITVTFIMRSYPKRIAISLIVAAIGLFFIAPWYQKSATATLLYVERNFFGVSRVLDIVRAGAPARMLMHGSTLHGIQGLESDQRLRLTAYYGILQEVFDYLTPAAKSAPVGVLGLGAGQIACLGDANQQFDFYEINPDVIAIATNPEFFTYLKDCKPRSRVVLGDGRLEIAKASNENYGLIILDAFNSDAIPAHLISSEAFSMYSSKLKKGGIIMVNISNRFFDFEPLMAALGEKAGFKTIVKKNLRSNGPLGMPSIWVAMAHRLEDFNGLDSDKKGWKVLENTSRVKPWTDNYSNIMAILL